LGLTLRGKPQVLSPPVPDRANYSKGEICHNDKEQFAAIVYAGLQVGRRGRSRLTLDGVDLNNVDLETPIKRTSECDDPHRAGCICEFLLHDLGPQFLLTRPDPVRPRARVKLPSSNLNISRDRRSCENQSDHRTP